MKNKFLFCIVFFGLNVSAGVMTSVGQNHDFEKSAEAGQYIDRTPLALRVGYREFENALFVEYNQFRSSESFSRILISRTHHELLVWGRHQFWTNDIFQLYTQAAPGLQLEHVQTNYFYETQEDTSKPVLALAAAAGLAVEINHYRVELEMRALTSALSNPNPTLGVGFYGGYLF
jgi:hypothetical protein